MVVDDDASSDDTAQRVETLGAPRVRLLRLAKNGGPAAARNAGLEAATGTWVGVLDSDETLVPERSARMLRAARASGRSSAVDQMVLFNPRNGQSRLMFFGDVLGAAGELDLERFVLGNVLNDGRVPYALGYLKPLVRRNLLERHGIRYDESLRIGEDFYFFAEARALGGPASVVAEPGYVYHVYQNSPSNRMRLDDLEALRAAQRRFVATHRPVGAAARACARRTRSLDHARDYLLFAEALQSRRFGEAFTIARRRPAVVPTLRFSLASRLAALRPGNIGR